MKQRVGTGAFLAAGATTKGDCETMILAGDIGGTKTVLALIDPDRGIRQPVREERFSSREHGSLREIVALFLKDGESAPTAASFGIAGRVAGRQARTTNLPWLVDADVLSRKFGIPCVNLLNDLQATAMAVPHLEARDIHILSEGEKEPEGAIGVIAPGTGLGEAYLTWADGRYCAWPSEGGHTSFAPVTQEQLELLEYLGRRFGHVSFERVCSGNGIPNIYDYLVATGRYDEPDWLRNGIKEAADPTPLIMNAGYERKAPICIAALDLFVRILGGVAGNMALRVIATGGLYLGGGIPPRILSRLEKHDFLDAICYKGRFRDWLARIPVAVILDSQAALHGAAWDALEAHQRQ